MSISTDDLNSFHQFATSIVTRGQTTLTLSELVDHWQQSKEREATNQSIRQSLAEFESGQGQPVEEFLDEIKSKHNLSLDSNP